MYKIMRFDLKNIIHETASFMIKSALVLVIFGMLAATAHGAAFLTDADSEVIDPPGNFDYTVLNNSNPTGFDDDLWADDWDAEPLNKTTLDKENYLDGIGYYAADTTNPEYTGFYIGTFTGDGADANDSDDDLRKLIEYFLGYNIADYEYAKVEDDNTADDKNDLKLTVTYDDSDNKSGSWNVTDINDVNSQKSINFYSVKGSTQFALYYVDPAQSSGNWTTKHLENSNNNNVPELSHLSVMITAEPIPEPATMLLFGFSLMGLAGMARRRNSKF